jgi:hypothetical protein
MLLALAGCGPTGSPNPAPGNSPTHASPKALPTPKAPASPTETRPTESPIESMSAEVRAKSSSPSMERPPKEQNRFISWLQKFTPTGGGGTSREAAYTNFMQGKCKTTLMIARTTKGEGEMIEPLEEPLRSVYEGAGAACLAALHGETELWKVAIENESRVDPSDLDCWDRSVFRILAVLVEVASASVPRGRPLTATGTAV